MKYWLSVALFFVYQITIIYAQTFRSSCDTKRVYPIVFGDGNNTFMATAADSYLNEDIIVAGQLRINITDYGVLIKMNRYGLVYWTRISYAKTLINIVKIFNDSTIFVINNQQVASATGVTIIY